jgi:transposase
MGTNNVSANELEERYKTEKDSKIKERLHMIILLKEGYHCRDVAKIHHTSKSKVSFWNVRFQKMEYDGLKDKKGRGIKPQLNDAKITQLDKKLSVPYKMTNGYTRGWQTKDVYQLIKNELGVEYSLRHIRRILRALGFVVLVPRPRNKKRNQNDVDEFQQEFKKTLKIWVKKQ